MKLCTQLNFGGNCEEAFRYYAKLLGGEISTLLRVRDMPDGAPRPPGSPEAVIYAQMDVAGTELIGNDVPPSYFKPLRSSYLYLSVDSVDEAERVYASLAEGGEIGMPMAQTFFAVRFAQLRDRFGTLWTILHQTPA